MRLRLQALFSLPVFGVPAHKGEAVANWDVLEKNRDELLSASESWGIVTVRCEPDDDNKNNILKLIDFKPFCPYKIDLDYYIRARDFFNLEEWIDILLGAADYNAGGYRSQKEKLAMLKRLMPFVEKRLNLVELAPKETGKSYLFSQVSQYGWLVSGGSVSRAKMFYDISKRTNGLVSHNDYVALDEVHALPRDALGQVFAVGVHLVPVFPQVVGGVEAPVGHAVVKRRDSKWHVDSDIQ